MSKGRMGTDERFVVGSGTDAVFSALANEDRIRLLELLYDPDESGMSFGELFAESGMDEKSRMAYHLEELQPELVQQTEEQYKLTVTGKKILARVRGGEFEGIGEVEEIDLDGDCPECGQGLTFTVEELPRAETDPLTEAAAGSTQVTIECGSCGRTLLGAVGVSKGLFNNHSVDEIPSAFHRWWGRFTSSLAYELCGFCQSDYAVELVVDEEKQYLTDTDVFVFYRCTGCPFEVLVSAIHASLWHPVVAAFYYEHGVDLRETPVWRLDLQRTGAELHDGPADGVTVTHPLDDEVLQVTFDEAFSVQGYECH